MKPTVTLLVGIPGSGKTTWANNNHKENEVVLSSDLIRKELFNDETNQENNKLVFTTLYKRARNLIKQGKSVIIDATNVTVNDRARALNNFAGLDVYKIAIVFKTEPDICKVRDKLRARTVGEEVINKFVEKFTNPKSEEGFNEIKYIE